MARPAFATRYIDVFAFQSRLPAMTQAGHRRLCGVFLIVASLAASVATKVLAQTPQAASATVATPTATTPASPAPASPVPVSTVPVSTVPDTTIANPLPALPVSVWSRQGVPVKAIEFQGIQFSADDRLLAQLQQKASQPLNPEFVRADLHRLFATGRYRDIAVYGKTTPDAGLTLVFAGAPRYFVGRVTILGIKEERLVSLLEAATHLDPGTDFTDAQIPAAVQGIKQTLQQNGYYEPKVDVTTTVDNVGFQLDATFTISQGVVAHIGNVAVQGTDTGISVDDFRKKAGMNCGRLGRLVNHDCHARVTRNTTSNALSGVRSFYQKNDRLEGTISLQDSKYAAPRKQLDYDFQANQGPIVNIRINGVKLSKSRTKLLVPVYEEGAVDIDLLNEGAFNIREYLQQKGYFDVEDEVQTQGEGTKRVLIEYNVKTGVHHKVTQVSITGNKYFDHDTIEELLRVKKEDAFQRSGRYSEELKNADIASIQALYRANGFIDVKVSATVKDNNLNGRGGQLKQAQIMVAFVIVEGPQQKFGDVDIAGVDPIRQKAVREIATSQTGQPFSFITLSSDRDAILTYYLSQGFDHARVDLAQEIDDQDKSRTDVTLRVTEGQQVFIDKVLLTGIVHTRPSVIKNQLVVQAGAPLDESALLQTQRNLYNLAEFNEVNAAVQNPDGDSPSKNVLVQLTEAKRWDVTYGFGFEAQTGTPAVVPGTTRGSTAAQNGKAGVSPRVSIDVSRINFRGTQDTVALHATYGLLERVATLSFNAPQLLGHRNLTASVSGGYTNVQNITTFASSTLQGDVRVTQKVKRADTFIYDFQYRRVSIDADSLEITPNLINQLSQPVIVGGPQLTYIHDTRDPSPLNAGRGQYFSIQEFLASSAFGSGTNFNKVDATQSSYYTFGKHKYVFARNLRVGFEKSWGPNPNANNAGGQIGVSSTACAGALLNTNPTCNAVPLPERLYAGGATSHRGFGINDAGPRDLTTGYPVGGNGVVVNTFELRLPPPTLPIVGDSVSFVLFHDMGNTFLHPGDMFTSFTHFHQPNQSTCRDLTIPGVAPGTTPTVTQQDNAVGTCSFNYYSHAVGVGVRYNTPVGPLRADFSYNLNPPIYPVFNDYTNALPYVGQANHFNFFFSIGQSF